VDAEVVGYLPDPFGQYSYLYFCGAGIVLVDSIFLSNSLLRCSIQHLLRKTLSLFCYLHEVCISHNSSLFDLKRRRTFAGRPRREWTGEVDPDYVYHSRAPHYRVSGEARKYLDPSRQGPHSAEVRLHRR